MSHCFINKQLSQSHVKLLHARIMAATFICLATGTIPGFDHPGRLRNVIRTRERSGIPISFCRELSEILGIRPSQARRFRLRHVVRRVRQGLALQRLTAARGAPGAQGPDAAPGRRRRLHRARYRYDSGPLGYEEQNSHRWSLD